METATRIRFVNDANPPAGFRTRLFEKADLMGRALKIIHETETIGAMLEMEGTNQPINPMGTDAQLAGWEINEAMAAAGIFRLLPETIGWPGHPALVPKSGPDLLIWVGMAPARMADPIGIGMVIEWTEKALRVADEMKWRLRITLHCPRRIGWVAREAFSTIPGLTAIP